MRCTLQHVCLVSQRCRQIVGARDFTFAVRAVLHCCMLQCYMVYVACTTLQVVDTGALDFEEPFAVRLLDFCDDRISDNVLFLKLRRFIHSGEPT